MVSVTGLLQGSGAQWNLGRGIGECVIAVVSIDGLVSNIGAPHSDCLLASSVVLQRVEAGLIQIKH